MTTFAARTLSFPSRAVSPLYFGNASTTDAGIELTPSARYQSGAAYLRDAWPMSAFGRYGGFDMSLTVLFDEQILQGADGIAFVFRSGPNAPKNASSGQPDILFYGGSPPAEGLFSIHFDTYQNVPVWNEPGSDFVAVYRDQNNVFDSRLCSRVQSTPPAVPFKGAPFNIRISTLGPGLLTPGSTNNVPDPSKQSRLRVSFWNQGDSEPTIPLMECGIDLGDIFKQSSLGTDGRQVWVGVTSLTGESANRHLITTASIKYCDQNNSGPTDGTIADCACIPNSTLSDTGACILNSTSTTSLTSTATSTSTSTSIPSSASSSSLSTGAIIGIAVGAGLGLLLLLGGLYLWIKKRKSDDDGYSLPELGESYAKKPPISPKPFAVEPPVYPDSSTASSATFADRAQSQSPYPTAYAADVPYNPNPMIAGTGTIPTGTELVVVMPFVPTQDDELVLNRGDRIVVDTVFEDGWAVGENMTTKATGHFPLAATIKSSELE